MHAVTKWKKVASEMKDLFGWNISWVKNCESEVSS